MNLKRKEKMQIASSPAIQEGSTQESWKPNTKTLMMKQWDGVDDEEKGVHSMLKKY